jgi:hypothetical protein
MTIKTPPKDWDRHAQVVARSIASLDRSRLPGSTAQFTAIVHEAIVDAMMMAAESSTSRLINVQTFTSSGRYTPIARSINAKVGEGGSGGGDASAKSHERSNFQAALDDIQDVRNAVSEFRAQQRDSYPHEAVAILLDAFDQLVRIADGALRELATCAKTQTGEVAPC